MPWYGEHIFPHLMEWVMGGEEFQKQRSLVLARAYGTVLEIGFGTGLNLPHYPAALSSLHAIDPAQGCPGKSRNAVRRYPFRSKFNGPAQRRCPTPIELSTASSVPGPSVPFPTRSRHFKKSVESLSLTECFSF